jgi:glycosyltransferase involved in cell wall biosynthesis
MRVVLTRREPLDDPDGINISIVALAQTLVELGHDVIIVVGSLRSDDEYRRLLAPRLDLPVIALSRTSLTGVRSALAWLRAKRVIDNFRPDLVIHNETVPLPLRGTIIQVVHDLEKRNSLLAPVRRLIRRFTTRRSHHVVATTSELRDAIASDTGLATDQLTMIPKCIDLHAYHGVAPACRERAILHAGTLPYKDPAATIRAFAALDDPSVMLYVSGEITRPTQQATDALPDKLRLKVSLLGQTDRDAVRKLHGRVRIAAFPTQYTTPVGSATVMEAIAAGTPIVGSSRISRDLLQDGVNGLTVDKAPAVMAAAFRVLLNDEALWARLSAGAAQMAERFDAYKVAAQYLSLATKGSRGARARPI